MIYKIEFFKKGKIVNELTVEYKGTATNAMFYATNKIQQLTQGLKYNQYTFKSTLIKRG